MSEEQWRQRRAEVLAQAGARAMKLLAYFAGIGLAALAVYLGVSYLMSTPKSGIVEAAWLEPAHEETIQISQICQKAGTSIICTPIYGTTHVPDACFVKINDTERTHREATWPIPCSYLPMQVGEWVTLR